VEPLDVLTAADLRLAMAVFRDCLLAHRRRIDALNVYPVPDADTGTNMALTMESVVAALEDAAGLRSTAEAIGRGALAGGRGISGVILCQLLRVFAAQVADLEAIDPRAFAQALRSASRAARSAVLQPVEGTILTVADAAADAAVGAVGEGRSMSGVLEAARAAADDAVERTPDLLPRLRAAGVVDAGGSGFVLFLDALLNVVDGRPVPAPPAEVPEPLLTALHEAAEAGGPRFELTCRLEAPDERIPALRERWATLGDAVVVVGGGSAWLGHLHTDDPEAALEAARALGAPSSVRVTDLAVQLAWTRGAGEAEPGVPSEPVETAAVAIGSGDGVRRLFASLGAARVVGRDDGASPSVGELLEAIEAAPSDAVVLVTNGAEAGPAVERARALSAKEVRVVPTRGIAEELTALQAYDALESLEENAARMIRAASSVRSGEIARAARDASSELGPIRAGDWLAMTPGGIVSVAGDVMEAIEALLAHLVEDEDVVVTVLEGEGSSEEATERVLGWLSRHHPGAGVHVLRGGQPTRPYVFGVE
jgi:DAK2 domain fusion protein YloV